MAVPGGGEPGRHFPDPGWYTWHGDRWRRWNGQRWVRRPRITPGHSRHSRQWATRFPTSTACLLVLVAICVLDIVGIGAGSAIVFHDVVLSRSVAVGAFVVVLAGLVLAIGLVLALTLGVLSVPDPWQPAGSRRWFEGVRRHWNRPGTRWLQLAIAAIVLFAILNGALSIGGAVHGSPEPPTATCRWPLVNHGVVTCVSDTQYLETGATLQRLVASILLGFFALQLGVLGPRLMNLAQARRAEKLSASAVQAGTTSPSGRA